MILQSEAEILRNLHIIAYSVVIVSFLLIAILFAFKMKGKPKNIKNYILGIVIFLTFYAVSRVMELTRMLISLILGTIDPDLGIALYLAGAIFGTVAVAIVLFVLEKYILEKKTKYILTILTISLLILSLIFNPRGSATGIGKIFLYISSAPALSIPIIYFYIGFKTSGDTRKRSITAGIGFLIAFFGIIVDTALGSLVFTIIMGDFMGTLMPYTLFMICVPVGLIIYYRSIQY